MCAFGVKDVSVVRHWVFKLNHLLAENTTGQSSTVHARAVCSQVLCLLECSKGGLKETELRHILSGDPPLPMILWAEVRRTLKPLVRNIGFRLEQETLHFFHPSISQASGVEFFPFYRTTCSLLNVRRTSLKLKRFPLPTYQAFT